jgi:hypothetical protein
MPRSIVNLPRAMEVPDHLLQDRSRAARGRSTTSSRCATTMLMIKDYDAEHIFAGKATGERAYKVIFAEEADLLAHGAQPMWFKSSAIHTMLNAWFRIDPTAGAMVQRANSDAMQAAMDVSRLDAADGASPGGQQERRSTKHLQVLSEYTEIEPKDDFHRTFRHNKCQKTLNIKMTNRSSRKFSCCNLGQHLHRCDPPKYEEIFGTDAGDGSTTMPAHQQHESNILLMQHIAARADAFNIGASDTLREFCHSLDPGYKLPGRKKIRSMMEQAHTTMQDKKVLLLERARAEIGGTAWCSTQFDFWSSRKQKDAYGALYVSFTLKYGTLVEVLGKESANNFVRRNTGGTLGFPSASDLILVNFLAGFNHFKSKIHNHREIAAWFTRTYKAIGLTPLDLSVATPDGAANGKLAMSILHIPQRTCDAHQLQRVVVYGYGDTKPSKNTTMKELNKKHNRVAGAVTKSTQRQTVLHEQQIAKGFSPLTILTISLTRWCGVHLRAQRNLVLWERGLCIAMQLATGGGAAAAAAAGGGGGGGDMELDLELEFEQDQSSMHRNGSSSEDADVQSEDDDDDDDGSGGGGGGGGGAAAAGAAPNNLLIFTEAELELSRQSESVLSLIYEAQRFLEGSHYCTISTSMPLIISVHMSLSGKGKRFQVMSADRSSIVKYKLKELLPSIQLMCKIMCEQIEKRFFASADRWTIMSLVLDPYLDHELLFKYAQWTAADNAMDRFMDIVTDAMPPAAAGGGAGAADAPAGALEPADFIGRTFRRSFDDHGTFTGRVVSTRTSTSGRTQYFAVNYPDGDQEDMTMAQLLKLLPHDASSSVGALDDSESDDSESDEDGASAAAAFAAAARRRFRATALPETTSPHARATEEVQRFLALAVAARAHAATSPLTFWSAHEYTMPTLYRLARIAFAVLSTEANAERAFSHSGAVLCAKRMRLDPDMASAATEYGMEYKLFALTAAEHTALAAGAGGDDE